MLGGSCVSRALRFLEIFCFGTILEIRHPLSILRVAARCSDCQRVAGLQPSWVLPGQACGLQKTSGDL